jgi:hypothetical protein
LDIRVALAWRIEENCFVARIAGGAIERSVSA